MNTTCAPTVPDAGDFNVKRELWRLPVGEVFQDWLGKQRFEKVAEIITARGEVRHAILCLASPFQAGQKLGPVCSAFFTTPGTLLFREGSLKVFVHVERKEPHVQET